MSESAESMKSQALLERIAQLTAEYENKIADFRVAYTMVAKERDELRAEMEGAEQPDDGPE